jgi:anaerobic selenocysteine-containing dehydrogenase
VPLLLGELRGPDLHHGRQVQEFAKADIIHIEGDPDNPVNRGTLCAKGAGLLDMVKSTNRLKYPEVREAGSNEWKRISWDDAITRIATHMKKDRDANLIEKNADGVTVNRWNTTGFLASSAANNESGYITVKDPAQPRESSHSTRKHVFDTPPRYPVWVRHLGVVQ